VADAANSGLEAEIGDILRNVKDDIQSAGGLGTEIAALFKGIGLPEGEEIPELQVTPSERPLREPIWR
jgi:hypothetical protein